MNVGTLTANFELDSKQFTTSIQQVESSLDTTRKKFDSTASSVNRSARSMAKSIGLVTASIAAVTLATYKGVVGFARMGAAIDAMDRKLKFSVGGQEAANREYGFLADTAERLGVSLEATVNSYANLAAASRKTALEGENTRQIFLSIAEAGTVLGLSTDAMKLSFRAIVQMISVGTIRSEELKGQLGDHLPGALAIFARSLGVTGRELEKLLESGSLVSSEVLPLFAKQLRDEFGPAVEDASKSATASLGRLETSWFNLRRAIVESELGEIAKVMIDALIISVNALNTVLRVTFKILKGIGEYQSTGLLGFMPGKDNIAVIEEYNEVGKKQADVMNDQAASTVVLTEALAKLREQNEELVSPENAAQFETMFELGKGALKSFEDEILRFVNTGKLSFESFAKSIISDMTRVALQIQITQPILQAWSMLLQGMLGGGGGGGIGQALFGGFSKVLGFANGGIIKEPIVGLGIKTGQSYSFGEEGPEMISPLTGGSPGDSGGGGSPSTQNISVNISAIDSKSLVDLMRANPDAITLPLSEALNVGDRGMINSLKGAVI